jgi:ribonuclease PH
MISLFCLPDTVLDTKVVSRAAGSAYLELGDTKVMAAV